MDKDALEHRRKKFADRKMAE